MMFTFIPHLLFLFAITEKIAGNAYCDKYGSSHTMCKSAPGLACGSQYEQFKFNEGQISDLLKLHNEFRGKAASGKETGTKGGPLPKASNMCEMKWDAELATIAQNLADQCVFKHEINNSDRNVLNQNKFYNVGQNIAMASSSPKASDSMGQFLTGASEWYSKEVNLFSASLIEKYVSSSAYGHYAQLIWADTCFIGCGGSIFVDGDWTNYFLVCNYGEAGLMPSDPVYKVGEPCSACKNGGPCSSTNPSLCA